MPHRLYGPEGERLEEDSFGLDETSDETAGVYPVRVVARLTGLSADTIRVWERRYGAVRPIRTDGNARRFTEAEVKRLILLREVTSRGHAIGDVGTLSDDELGELAGADVRRDLSVTAETELAPYLESFVDSVIALELRRADALLHRLVAVLSPREIARRVVVPIARDARGRVLRGELTATQGRIVSSRLKPLCALLSRLAPLAADAPRVLIASRFHGDSDLGMLIAALITEQRGYEPIMIGGGVSYEELAQMAREARPELLMIAYGAEGMHDDELASFRDALGALEPHDVWVGSVRHHPIRSIDCRARFFSEFEEFEAALNERTRGRLTESDARRPRDAVEE